MSGAASAKLVDQGYETNGALGDKDRTDACATAKRSAKQRADLVSLGGRTDEVEIGECEYSKDKNGDHKCGVNWKVIGKQPIIATALCPKAVYTQLWGFLRADNQ